MHMVVEALEVKSKVTVDVAIVEPSAGPPVIETVGPDVSTVKWRVTRVVPISLVASTVNT